MKTVTRFIFAIVAVMILSACAKMAMDTQCATPTLNPASGSGQGPLTVKIETSTPGAFLRWTDVSPPPPQSGWHTITAQKGDAPTVFGRTLRAMAFKTGMTDSGIATGTYVAQ